MSEVSFLDTRWAELEGLPRWRMRIDWLRLAAQAPHPRVLERGSISRYSYDELEQLERAGQKRFRPLLRDDEETANGMHQRRGHACVQRYIAGIRRTAERDLGMRALAPAVHILVRGQGYVLPRFVPATQPPASNGSETSSLHAHLRDPVAATAGRGLLGSLLHVPFDVLRARL